MKKKLGLVILFLFVVILVVSIININKIKTSNINENDKIKKVEEENIIYEKEENTDNYPCKIQLIGENNGNRGNSNNDINDNSNNNDKNYDNVEMPTTLNLLDKTFTVYFDYDGGVKNIESKAVTYQKQYGELPIPEKEGYTFDGWYTSKDYNERIESTSIENINKDHTLYAHYNINKYSITYDYNYLENNLYKKLTDKTYWNTYNFDILMNDEIFLNENVYKFIPDFENSIIEYNENVKLENGKTYTYSVYIKTNDDKDLLIGLSDDPIKIKTTSSWQRFTKTFVANEDDYTNFIFSLDNNLTWNKDDTIEIYGLTLSEGNLNTMEIVKNYNEKLGKIDIPIRDGYIFDGWYTDFEFKEKINVDGVVYSNVIYYAKWNPIMYTLEINPNGGMYEDDISNRIFTQGFETIKKLDKPKATYKIIYNLNNTNASNNKSEDLIDRPFKGFIDENNELYDSDSYIFNKNSLLNASYEENIDVVLDTITKPDYICSWNTKGDGSGEKYDSGSIININSDVNLYANCERKIKFKRPINFGCLTSEYGYRIHPIYGYEKFHSGIDMSSNDRNIYSVADGVVAKTGNNSSMGNYIIIYHNINGEKYTSAYYHLELKYVYEGQAIMQDTIIGKMGSTGAATGVHLHLTMYKGYLYEGSTTMVNPRNYINFPTKLYNYWNDRNTYY